MTASTVIGVDPGQTTGLAMISTDAGDLLDAKTAKSAEEVVETLQSWLRRRPPGFLVVIEDYVGGGWRDKDSVYTLKMIGLVQGFLCHAVEGKNWADVVVQVPQKRQRYLEPARELIARTTLEERTADLRSPHVRDALAHALSRRTDAGEHGRALAT